MRVADLVSMLGEAPGGVFEFDGGDASVKMFASDVQGDGAVGCFGCLEVPCL